MYEFEFLSKFDWLKGNDQVYQIYTLSLICRFLCTPLVSLIIWYCIVWCNSSFVRGGVFGISRMFGMANRVSCLN